MKTRYLLMPALFGVALLAGCTSDYVMATKDGQTILIDGKPEIDKTTVLIRYTDQCGSERQIKQQRCFADNRKMIPAPGSASQV